MFRVGSSSACRISSALRCGFRYQSAAAAAAAAASSSSSAGTTGKVDGDFSHITRNSVWSLWNEGNLFSLSIAELSAFLRTHCKSEVDPKAKKSALVRQVEEIMSAEQSSLTVAPPEDGTIQAAAASDTDYGAGNTTLFDEADVYGDWGAEPGFEDRRELDFMELSPAKMQETYEALSPRAFQLLHADLTADVGLTKFKPTKLPGHAKVGEAYCAVHIPSNDANKVRFRRAFKWCCTNLWNMNISGELNIGAGKALYWRSVAKHNRNILPIWTCQQHLYNSHPYTWFAVAHESNVGAIEALARKLDMSISQEPTTSYKVFIKKQRELLDCELNEQLRCVSLNKPWDRFLCTHVLRRKMPDLRYLVRARHPIKKRIADSYMEADILRSTRDSVQSILSPDLGDVCYCSERVMRKWSTRLPSGVTLQLVETKRIPLIVTRQGEEGERLEYEFIVALPQQQERVDVHALSDELWEFGNELATVLETGMQELQAHTMPSSAAFEQVSIGQQ